MPPMHAVIVGSDMGAQTKFETELRNFVSDKKIQYSVHFVNKTLNVAPYLASIDILVQNSQVPTLIAHVYIYVLSHSGLRVLIFKLISPYHLSLMRDYYAKTSTNLNVKAHHAKDIGKPFLT